MLVRRTCVWNFAQSFSGTSVVKGRLCGPWIEPTSRNDMDTLRRQPQYRTIACQPRSVIRLSFKTIGWYRTWNPPNLYWNSKTIILQTQRPVKGLNEILCGCNNPEYAVGVQWWVCKIHPLHSPRTESAANLGNPVYIFSWWREKAN